jgi:hypothetical protein
MFLSKLRGENEITESEMLILLTFSQREDGYKFHEKSSHQVKERPLRTGLTV